MIYLTKLLSFRQQLINVLAEILLSLQYLVLRHDGERRLDAGGRRDRERNGGITLIKP
jgi:hypothetical protein